MAARSPQRGADGGGLDSLSMATHDEGGWGAPPWRLALALPAAELPKRCDVAVLGAGLTGLAAARVLAERGPQVAVLEAERVGSGASGRTGGIVLEGTHLGELPQVDGCVEALRALTERLGVDCGLMLCGCAELAHQDPGAEPGAESLAWRDDGRRLAVVERVPGGVVDPGRLVEGLARAALGAGATFHEGARVGRVEADRCGALRLETARGVLRADAAVLALNAFTAGLLELPVTPIAALTFVLCTEPLEPDALSEMGLAAPCAFYTIDLPFLWGRTLPDGGLMLGGGLVRADPHELRRVRLTHGQARERLAALERRVRALHPRLRDAKLAYRWAGPIALMGGRAPYLFRHPPPLSLVVAGGYTGHGVAASVRFGELAARALAEDTPLPAWGAPDGAAPR